MNTSVFGWLKQKTDLFLNMLLEKEQLPNEFLFLIFKKKKNSKTQMLLTAL